MRDEADALKRERVHLAGTVGEARTRAEQRRWVILAGGLGIAIGFALFAMLTGLTRI